MRNEYKNYITTKLANTTKTDNKHTKNQNLWAKTTSIMKRAAENAIGLSMCQGKLHIQTETI